MKIAVVGANSYIARNLIYVLRKRISDYNIALYDNAETHFDEEENYTRINIVDRESISHVDMDCNIIFMFAGKTGSERGFDEYKSFVDVNEIGLLNLLDEYRKQKSKAKIIYPSTRLIYKGSNLPLNENAEKEFNTIYAINKFACEQYLLQYSRVFNVKYCVFRICIPYGTLVPRAASYGTIAFMLDRASAGKDIIVYGDGSFRRTFSYIEDICNNLIDGGLSDRCINDTFNIGGENLSLNEVAEMISRKYGVGIKFAPYPKIAESIETGDTVFDDKKISQVLLKSNHKFSEWIAHDTG